MKTRILIAAVTCLCAASLTSCRSAARIRASEPSAPSTSAAPGTANPASGVSAALAESERIPIRLSLFICCQYSEGVPADQIAIDDFNASQDKIQLIRDICCNTDALAAKYASGDGPDIIGPMEWPTSDLLRDQWLDLTPLIRAANYDVTQFNPALIKMYATPEGQVGLPFIVNPSVVFFNKKLFDKAGLDYPPAAYGEKYRMPDSSEVEWSWETVQNVARMLTLDGDGRKADESGFKKDQIVQYGFTWNFEFHPNILGSYWAGGTMLAPNDSPGDYKAQVPDAWKAAWEWTYDGIWGHQPFMANHTVEFSEEFESGNPFKSNKVAMTILPSWYLCCMKDVKTWDAAALPAYKEKVGGRIEAGTFRIWKGTKHPQEAFTVLSYLLGDAVQKLVIGSESMIAPWSGSMPARIANQEAWLEIQKKAFPWVQNWDVFIAGLNYPDIPSADASMPNFHDAWSRGLEFADLLRNNGGLNLAKEIQTYTNDLTDIFNR
jgi:multiple sugar transport system substrate-binding protein